MAQIVSACCSGCSEPFEYTKLHKGFRRTYCDLCQKRGRRRKERISLQLSCAECLKSFTYRCYANSSLAKYCRPRCQQKASWRRKTWKMTSEQWHQLLTAQRHRCKICDEVLQPGKRTAIDHDHVTGHIRGVLCSWCNRGLGFLDDCPKRLQIALAYLLASPPALSP